MPNQATQTVHEQLSNLHATECQWVGADGNMVGGSFQEHEAFLQAERAHPAQAIARIEAKIAVAQAAAAPAAIVATVAEMAEPELRGLARAIQARHVELKLDPPKAKGVRPQSAFTGSTGLARACVANKGFKIASASSKPKPSIPTGLTGVARAIAANKANQARK